VPRPDDGLRAVLKPAPPQDDATRMSSLLSSARGVLAGSLIGMRRDAASEFMAEWRAQGDVATLHLGPRGIGRWRRCWSGRSTSSTAYDADRV
jgi:hypothetical protein